MMESQSMAKEQLISAVLDAVDGTFRNARKVVVELVESNVALSEKEASAIMASFLMEQSDSICIQNYGEGHGHDFLKAFGAKAPKYSINQLHSHGLGKLFYDKFIRRSSLTVNQTLRGLFCTFFQLQDIETPSAVADPQNQANYLRELKGKISEKRLVVMSGIGVSLGIFYNIKLTWEGLLDAIRVMLNDRVANPIPEEDWVTGCPEEKAKLLDVVVRVHFPHLDYRQFVSVIMRDIVPQPNHPLGAAISNLALPIATTNYDLVLEQSLLRFEKNLSHMPVRFSLLHHYEFVYHVHGVWFDSNSVVLSNDDYERTQYDFEYAIGKLFFDFAGVEHRSLLFIGSKFGMIDSHFSVLYTDPRYAHLRHFALLKRGDFDSLIDNPKFLAAVNAGKLVPIIYGTTNEELTAFLMELIQ